MNLILHNFQTSSLLSHLPPLESVVFKGENESKIKVFEAVKGGETCKLFSIFIIRKEEKLVWNSFKEVLEQAMRIAVPKIRGLFGLDVLSLDLREGTEHFDWQNLGNLIINKGQMMKLGEEVLIKYGPLYGLFKKRVDETWGRIDLKVNVEVYNKEPHQFDLFIKKVLKDSQALDKKALVTVCDLSNEPIFQFGSEPQTERLRSFLDKQKDAAEGSLPDIYIVQGGKAVELKSQFNI